jgi:hypothetical protein
VGLWTAVIYLRIQADGGFLVAIKRTIRLHKRQDRPCLAERLFFRTLLPEVRYEISHIYFHCLAVKFPDILLPKLPVRIHDYTRTTYSNVTPM